MAGGFDLKNSDFGYYFFEFIWKIAGNGVFDARDETCAIFNKLRLSLGYLENTVKLN